MRKKAFTLIEVMVVITVIGLVVPTLFYMIFSILLQQVKIYRLSEVKRQGDFALTVMLGTIRNSGVSIYDSTNSTEICKDAGDTGDADYFHDAYDNWFRFYINNNKISSGSAVPGATTDLTRSNVVISNFTMTCNRTATFSAPIVEVKFTITAGDGSSRAEEKASLTYQTRVKLRNY